MSNRIAGAIDELYGLDPAQFTARRTVLAEQARTAGDREAAREITSLRRPTRSAWTVNRLVRGEPDAVGQLAELGADLRAAERTLDGARLRELSVRRHKLVDALTRRAFELIELTAPSIALRDDVRATLDAAVADPEVAEGLATGRLLQPARWDGFGATATQLSVVPMPRIAGEEQPRPRKNARAEQAQRATPVEPTAAAVAQRARTEAAAAALVDAEAALAAAVDEEQAWQDRTRLLQDQLADTRRRGDEARLEVRHARAVRDKAKQRLDRLERG